MTTHWNWNNIRKAPLRGPVRLAYVAVVTHPHSPFFALGPLYEAHYAHAMRRNGGPSRAHADVNKVRLAALLATAATMSAIPNPLTAK